MFFLGVPTRVRPFALAFYIPKKWDIKELKQMLQSLTQNRYKPKTTNSK